MDFTGERFIPCADLGQEIAIEHLQRYRAILDLAAGKTVLDAASGAGYGSRILAERARLVCGVEIDPEAVAQAQERYGDANLCFVQGSASFFPFPAGTFDLIVSFETIEHLPEETQRQFLLEIKRVLKVDGILVMSTPDRRIYSDLPDYHNEFHRKEFYREEFAAFLADGFSHVQFLEQAAVLAYFIATGKEANFTHVPIFGSPALQGKYLVALCSAVPLPDFPLACLTIDQEDLHQKKVARVIELQGEIEGKNEDISNVWKEVHKRDDTIMEMSGVIQKKEQTVVEMSGVIQNSEQTIKRLHAELAVCQASLEGSAQSQQKAEECLRHICATRAWRFIQKLYGVKNKLW